jgi:hypothetical protein
MAVTQNYLDKLLRAVRIRNANDEIRTEVCDLCEEARLDLETLGVLPEKARDEADPLILGAVRSFVRWKMAADEKEAQYNMQDYMLQRDEMRRRSAYTNENG